MSRPRNADLKELFASSQSKSFARLNAGLLAQNTRKASIVECPSRNESLAAGEVQEADTGPVLVRVTSYRVSLLDEDGLAEKYHVDCLRYAGILRGDSPKDAHIEVSQVKVAHHKDEFTLLEIFTLP